MHSPSLRFLSLTLAAVALLFAGCASGPEPRAYTVKVSLDPALAGGSIQVDLIGANPTSDLPKLEGYPVSQYWTPGDKMRADSAKVTLDFGQGRTNSQVLEITNPIWQTWLKTGAQQLVVIVDLPGVDADKAGNADPRRLILPLDANQWKDPSAIEILIQESGARLLTPKKS